MGFPPSLAISREELLDWYRSDPLGLLLHCRDNLGEIFTLDLGYLSGEGIPFNGKWVFLTHPDHLRVMFRAPIDQLHAGEANAIFFGIKTATTGTIRMDGAEHSKRRKLFQPLFNGPSLYKYIGGMRQVTRELLADWPKTRPFSLLTELQRITIHIIIHTVFGIEAHGVRDPLCEKLLLIENALFSHEQVIEIEKELSRLIYSLILEYRADSSSTDIFHLLMNTRDELGSHLDDKEVHDELITLLKAGFGTTANTLAWIFECLLSHPQALDKVQAEMKTVLKTHSDPTGDSLQKLEYLENAIRETLRLRPLAAVNGCRLSKTPFEVGGYNLPPGTILVNCAYLLHRRPELYPDPDAFLPERFFKQKPNPYEWTPFGGGGRMCAGRAFAMMEMKMIVTSILQQVKLELVDYQEGVERQGFFLAPKKGLMVQIC